MKSSNHLVLNMNTIVLITQYFASNMKELSLLRLVNRYFCETVDDRVICVWCYLLREHDILKIFKKAIFRTYSYVFSACKWIKDKIEELESKRNLFVGDDISSIKLSLEIAQRIIRTQDLRKFDFERLFVLNERPEVDEFFIKQGYINTMTIVRSVKKTALHYAAEERKYDRILLLLKCGADVNVLNSNCFSAFETLCLSLWPTHDEIDPKLKEIVDIFIARSNIDNINSAFTRAYNMPRLVKYFIDNVPDLDVNCVDNLGHCPLFIYAVYGLSESLRVLLTHAKSLNINYMNHTINALGVALTPRGNIENAIVLLEHCINITPGILYNVFFCLETAMLGDTPTFHRMIQILLDSGKVEICGMGIEPLAYATKGISILTLIYDRLGRKASLLVTDRDSIGNTALSYAYKFKQLDCVRFLVEKGADLSTMHSIIPKGAEGYRDFEKDVENYTKTR